MQHIQCCPVSSISPNAVQMGSSWLHTGKCTQCTVRLVGWRAGQRLRLGALIYDSQATRTVARVVYVTVIWLQVVCALVSRIECRTFRWPCIPMGVIPLFSASKCGRETLYIISVANSVSLQWHGCKQSVRWYTDVTVARSGDLVSRRE